MLSTVCAILICTSALLNPQEQPDRQRNQRKADRPRHVENEPINEETLRKRLEQTKVYAERIIEKNQAALDMLEAGEDPKLVLKMLRSPVSRRELRESGKGDTQARPQNTQRRGGSAAPRKKDHPVLSKEDHDRVRMFISDHMPSINEHLVTVEQLAPEASKKLIARLSPKILEILELQEYDSALSSLRLDELKADLAYIDAARIYRGLIRTGSQDEQALSDAEEQVRVTASARFDAQVRIKQHEISQLNNRIAQLQDSLDELNAQREDQVQSQVNAARRTPGPRFNRNNNQRIENQPTGSPDGDSSDKVD